jgi:PAT family acetyl-CoA transporter-like MFS transporter 1
MTLNSNREAIDFSPCDNHAPIRHIKRNSRKPPSVRSEWTSIVFLIFMYFLQAIPVGLDKSIPMILGSRNATYDSQGTFSWAFWPFSLKLLWAPIIDVCYFKFIGRRKSWAVFTNLIIGIVFISCAQTANTLLYESKVQTSICFFFQTPRVFIRQLKYNN